MTARPVDALVVQAFLEAVSPLRLAVALQVLDRVEEDLVAQRRQQELQLEQARYEARHAQRQYDACDPDNRLVAAELERRWNEKLVRVTQLERVAAQAEQDARWTLTTTERTAISALSQICRRSGTPARPPTATASSCSAPPLPPSRSMAKVSPGRSSCRSTGTAAPSRAPTCPARCRAQGP
jgi:hypothetical protein